MGYTTTKNNRTGQKSLIVLKYYVLYLINHVVHVPGLVVVHVNAGKLFAEKTRPVFAVVAVKQPGHVRTWCSDRESNANKVSTITVHCSYEDIKFVIVQFVLGYR